MDKFCVGCDYFEPHYGRFESHLCKHPENGTVSPVFGVLVDRSRPDALRESGGKCGPEGAMWTQKVKRSVFKRSGFMSMLLLD
jgi:hypothetical protein